VPLNIEAGRHSFSIGYNPLQLSDQTEIFIISPSQISSVAVAPGPSTTNTVFQTYKGCGLPPFPDYTYTGYQPPCTVTTSGHVETLYPIVPASDSSSFFNDQSSTTTTALESTIASLSPSEPTAASSTRQMLFPTSTSINPAFATGVYAQALQCPTPVTPSTTQITSSGTTTILSMVGCSSTSEASANRGGICHLSGYSTFSVSGTRSVCCPDTWSTTTLISELFCFTSVEQGSVWGVSKRGLVEERQNMSQGLAGLVFTSAGVVTHDAASTGSSSASSGSSAKITSSATGSAASASTTKSGGVKLGLALSGAEGIAVVICVLCCII